MRRDFIFRKVSNGDHYFGGWKGFTSPFKPADVSLAQEASWYIADMKLSYYLYNSLANGDIINYGIEYKGDFFRQTEDKNVFVRETETGKKVLRFTSNRYGYLEDVILEESYSRVLQSVL